MMHVSVGSDFPATSVNVAALLSADVRALFLIPVDDDVNGHPALSGNGNESATALAALRGQHGPGGRPSTSTAWECVTGTLFSR